MTRDKSSLIEILSDYQTENCWKALKSYKLQRKYEI